MKKLVVLFLLVSVNYLYGQNDTTARMILVAGGSTNFHFNSYTKMNSGMEYLNWTRFRTFFVVTDGPPAYNVQAVPWKLSVRSNSATINGDDGNTLGLGVVRVRAEPPIGTGVWQTLSNIDVPLVTNGAWNTTETVIISYECGIPPGCLPVLGEAPDFYFADLIFTLEADD